MLFSLCYRNIIFPHGMLLLLYRLCSVDMKKKRFIHEEVYACARPSGDLTIGITCPHSKTLRPYLLLSINWQYFYATELEVYLIICAPCV